MNKSVLILSFIIILVLAIFTSGCANVEVLQKVIDASNNVDSYKYHSEIDNRLYYKNSTFQQDTKYKQVIDGVIDMKERKMWTKTTITSDYQTYVTEIYLIDSTIYANSPDLGWVKQTVATSMWDDKIQLSQQLDSLKDSKVKYLGEQDVNGQTARVYEFRPSIDAMKQYVNSQQLDLPASVKWDKVIDSFYFKQWFGKNNNYPLKGYFTLKIVVNKNTAGAEVGDEEIIMESTTTLTNFDFNKRANIQLPPEALNAVETQII